MDNPVQARKFTVQATDPFVVFLIGMRVNKLSAFRQWMPIAVSFPKMINLLQSDPELGMLSNEQFFNVWPLTTLSLSYWKSFEHLERFARGKGGIHAEAWARFNREIGYTNGTVGIYHETYVIDPGKAESLYGNMPFFGLSKAMPQAVFDAERKLQRARGRMAEPTGVTPEVEPEIA